MYNSEVELCQHWHPSLGAGMNIIKALIVHFDFVRTQLDEMNPTVLCHLRDVQKFLIWKIEHFSTEAQAFELSDIAQRNLDQILLLPQKTYKYTKGMIQQFTELLWQESIQNLLMTEGWSEIPRVSCNPLPIPHVVQSNTS